MNYERCCDCDDVQLLKCVTCYVDCCDRFRPASGRSLSAMIRGNAGITTHNYDTLAEACGECDCVDTCYVRVL